MNKQHSRQDGFSTVELVIVIVVIVVLSAAGVVVYRHNHDTHTKADATTTTTTDSTKQNTPSPNQSTQQPAQQYLVVKEWGVQLPVSNNINDAYYVVSTSSSTDPDGLSSAVWLGLKSNTSSSCDPANNNKGSKGAIGAILRVPPDATDPVSGELLTQKYPNGTTVGSYYYAYQSWSSNNPCAPQSTLQTADTAFASAAKNLTKASSSTQ